MKNILRRLPNRWRPNITTIQEAKYLNSLSLEELVSSLRSHEIELNENEPNKKSKSIALISKGNKIASKALHIEEKTSQDEFGD